MFHLTENQYLERYKMPDIESALLDGKLNEIFEQNNYDLDIITNIPKFANSKDFINWKQHFIYEIVSDFTSRNVFADTKKKRLDMLVRHGVIESYEIDGHTLMLKLEGDEKPMFFSTLTDEFPKLALMDIELTSKNARAGHCRTKSLHTVSPALLKI